MELDATLLIAPGPVREETHLDLVDNGFAPALVPAAVGDVAFNGPRLLVASAAKKVTDGKRLAAGARNRD